MSIRIDDRIWVPHLVVVFALALGWVLPAHAESCNAVHLDGQSLTIHWDEQTIVGCLNAAQKLETEIDQDAVEAATHALDDACARLETNHLSGDALRTAQRVCAKLRADIKR